MGVPAGVPGFLMLPGGAGEWNWSHLLHKEQLALSFVQSKLSLDSKEHPSKGGPSSLLDSRAATISDKNRNRQMKT